MRHFPIFMDLHGSRVLVLGTGEVAERKAEPLRRAGALVEIAPTFDATQLAGCVLAVGADAPEAELVALSQAARAAGIPVNVVDQPALCSFITPSIIDRDPVTIAVSSSGTAPVLARLLRARIEAMIPPAYGRLAALADSFKAEIRRRLPDLAQRRRVLERLLTGHAADLVFAGREDDARAEFARVLADNTQSAGMVFLVGAGPGSADLLTLRAQRLMGEADVIVHDRLVTPEVMDMARRDAERIYVGKARANHCMRQEDINALLVRLGQEGRKVVRLKGGDPFVFGRGGEEMEFLRQHGIAYEVVPGITAAVACAAYAGIPLTHRDHAQSVRLLTAHCKESLDSMDWAALAQDRQTLAIYMSVTRLDTLSAGLLLHGLRPDTPFALIENGTRPQQRVLRGVLQQLPALARQHAISAPAMLVIGAVAALADAHAWFGELLHDRGAP